MLPDENAILILKPEMVKIADTARIDSFVKIEGGQGVIIRHSVHVSSFCHINIGGGHVTIHEGAALASGAKVLGGYNTAEGVSMSAAADIELQIVERSQTIIKKNAFIGVNAVILPGVTIGEGAIIGAGAVVRTDVPDFEVWAGVPAVHKGVRGHRTANRKGL
jgi:acetyltransferase-like isoleucine patch superfamily enzyme